MKVKEWEHKGKTYRKFWCPACQCMHVVNELWGYNGDGKAPTITPSVLVTYDGPDAGQAGAPPSRCHSFVTGGVIAFCGDSTHALAGKTVALEELREEKQGE